MFKNGQNCQSDCLTHLKKEKFLHFQAAADGAIQSRGSKNNHLGDRGKDTSQIIFPQFRSTAEDIIHIKNVYRTNEKNHDY